MIDDLVTLWDESGSHRAPPRSLLALPFPGGQQGSGRGLFSRMAKDERSLPRTQAAHMSSGQTECSETARFLFLPPVPRVVGSFTKLEFLILNQKNSGQPHNRVKSLAVFSSSESWGLKQPP